MIADLRSLARRIIDKIRTYLFIMDVVSCFPELKGKKVTQVKEGNDNYTIEFDRELIFQTPRRKEDRIRMVLEYDFLKSVHAYLNTRIPDPVYFSDGKGKCRAVIIGYRKIDGISAQNLNIMPEDTDSFARQIGTFLRNLHSIPEGSLNESFKCDRGSINYFKKHQTALDFFYQKGDKILEPEEYSFLRDYLNSNLGDLGKLDGRRCVIHHDLRVEHILWDPGNMQISGVVDWMDGCLGDPSEDFAFIARDFGFDLYREILKYYGNQDGGELVKRSCFYSILSFFNDIVSAYRRDTIKLQETLARLNMFISAIKKNFEAFGISLKSQGGMS